MKKNNYIVIGIDGADYRVLKKMAANGIMPRLSKIMENSDCSNLDTYGKTLGQGWATLMTGLSPAEHGINYWKITQGTKSNDFSVPLLWDVIGAKGLSSGLVNLSYTFPPSPINGFMISGLGGGLSPVSSVCYTYPEGLVDELGANAEGYIWGLERGEGSIKQHLDYLEKLRLMTKKRNKACCYLLDTKKPDFFMVVFRGADAIQHSFWKALEIEGPAPAIMKDLTIKIHEYYSELDQAIHDLWNYTSPNKRLIVSDHGFGPTTCFFRVNELLCESGLLFKNYSPKALVGNKAFHTIKNLFGPFYRQYLSKYDWIQKANKKRAASLPKVEVAIDWKKTELYANDGYGVRYNHLVCDSEPKKQAAFEKLKEQIGDCVNPVTKKPIFKNFYRKEYLGIKKFENTAPDIVFDLSDESCLIEPDITMKKDTAVFIPIDQNPLHFMSGSHRRRGVLISDPGYLKVADADLNMEDIYTTILASLGIKAPEYAKGVSLI